MTENKNDSNKELQENKDYEINNSNFEENNNISLEDENINNDEQVDEKLQIDENIENQQITEIDLEENNEEITEELEDNDEEFVNEEENNNLEENINCKKKFEKKYLKMLLIAVTIFSLGGLSVFGLQSIMGTTYNTSKVTVTKEEAENEQLTVNAISKAKDAVVSVINYKKTSSSSILDTILGENYTDGDLKASSNGSGVIYKKEGNIAYIVTNEHVINGAGKLSVILSDGTLVDAELVGNDIWTDLAVLKISGDNVSVVMDFANSNEVAVGQTALAIGSPLGVSLSNSVTKGIVSAVERQVPMDIDKDGSYDWYQTVMQTDAAINPGNSGGALINISGQLIGINQLKASSTTSEVSTEGIGFVIPANEVKLIAEQLEKEGKVTRSALGIQLVSISTLNADLVETTLKYDASKKGVVIKAVESGSAAETSGLKQYDIITKINDITIENVADLRKYLFEKTKIGETVTVTYYREGKEYAAKLTLGTLK